MKLHFRPVSMTRTEPVKIIQHPLHPNTVSGVTSFNHRFSFTDHHTPPNLLHRRSRSLSNKPP
ncbi:hypothetical protein Hanom_Chr03g00194551 [Helianthus anomalus]